MACFVVPGQGISMPIGATIRSQGVSGVSLGNNAIWHLRAHFRITAEPGGMVGVHYIVHHTTQLRLYHIGSTLTVELLDDSLNWNVFNINLNPFGVADGTIDGAQICVEVMVVNLGRPGELSPNFGTTATIRIQGWLVDRLVLPGGVYFNSAEGDLFFGNDSAGDSPFFGILDDICVGTTLVASADVNTLHRIDIPPFGIQFLKPFFVGSKSDTIRHYWSFDTEDGWSGNSAIDLGSVGGWNMPFSEAPTLVPGPVRVLSGGTPIYRRTNKLNAGIGIVYPIRT